MKIAQEYDDRDALLRKIKLLENQAVWVDADDYAANQPPIPWNYYDNEHKLFVNQTSAGVMIKIKGMNYWSFSNEKKREIYKLLYGMFQTLPELFVVQVHEVHTGDMTGLFRKKELEIEDLKEKYERTGDGKLIFLVMQQSDQLNALRKRWEKGVNAPKQIEHYMTIYKMYPPNFNVGGLKIYQKRYMGLPAKTDPGQKKSLTEYFRDLNKEIYHVLNFLGMKYDLVNQRDFIQLMRSFFNVDFMDPIYDDVEDQPITKQFMDKDTYYSTTSYNFPTNAGDSELGALTLKKTESQVFTLYSKRIKLSALSALATIPKNFLVTTSFFKDPNIKRTKAPVANELNITMGPLGSHKGREKHYKQQVIFDQKMQNDSMAAFRSSTVINYHGTADENAELQKAVWELTNKGKLDATVKPETKRGPAVYVCGLPFGYDPDLAIRCGFDIPILSESSRSIIPIFGNFPSYRDEELLKGLCFQTEEGRIVYLDPFQLANQAKHILVVGGQGSGKSAFMNYFLEYFIIRGGSAFCWDPDASMKQTILGFGGKYYDVTPSEPFQVNIFDGELYPIDFETGERTDEKMRMMINFLTIMCYGLAADKQDYVRVQKAQAEMRRAIEAAFKENEPMSNIEAFGVDGEQKGSRRVREVTLSLVRSKLDLKGTNADIAKEVYTLLEPFCGKGPYAKYFDGEFPAMQEDVVGINLKNIIEDKKLYNLLMMTFCSRAREVFSKNRQKGKPEPSFMPIDEFGASTENNQSPYLAETLADLGKTARKMNVLLMPASQSFRHFASQKDAPNPLGETMLEACKHYALLMQDDQFLQFAGDEKREITRNLSEATKQRITELRTLDVKDGYSQFYFYSNHVNERGFFRFYATKRELMTYSTNPKDINLRNQAKAELSSKYSGSELIAKIVERALQLKEQGT